MIKLRLGRKTFVHIFMRPELGRETTQFTVPIILNNRAHS